MIYVFVMAVHFWYSVILFWEMSELTSEDPSYHLTYYRMLC
jgi:hypothetical protein